MNSDKKKLSFYLLKTSFKSIFAQKNQPSMNGYLGGDCHERLGKCMNGSSVGSNYFSRATIFQSLSYF